MELILDINDSEKSLIQACIEQEVWAQKQIYEEYYSSMMKVCLRYANNEDEALDILHDGFIKIFRHISKYQLGTSLTAWIRRIMVNTCIDYYRKELRRKTEDLDQAFNIGSNDPDMISNLNAEEILSCLQHLSVSYRSVFNLYVIEGFSHREIATFLGITESTSRSNLVKARMKLKELLLIKEITHGQK